MGCLGQLTVIRHENGGLNNGCSSTGTVLFFVSKFRSSSGDGLVEFQLMDYRHCLNDILALMRKGSVIEDGRVPAMPS